MRPTSQGKIAENVEGGASMDEETVRVRIGREDVRARMVRVRCRARAIA